MSVSDQVSKRGPVNTPKHANIVSNNNLLIASTPSGSCLVCVWPT